jgi:hypothetical protein
MGRRDQRIRESLGYSPSKKEKPERLMVPFNNKHEKWLYMKEKGLDEAFLAIKDAFQSCEEPIIFRRKN